MVLAFTLNAALLNGLSPVEVYFQFRITISRSIYVLPNKWNVIATGIFTDCVFGWKRM